MNTSSLLRPGKNRFYQTTLTLVLLLFSVAVTAAPYLTMNISKTSISGTADSGSSDNSQSFTVSNGSSSGNGGFSYMIQTDADWIEVTPSKGFMQDSSQGQVDTINVSLNAEALASQTYNGTITITSQETANSPQTISVTFNVTGSVDLAVGYPFGDEQLYQGAEYEIEWTANSNVTGNVKIELLKNGSVDSTIAASTPNTGSYEWTIPEAQTAGTDYKIRITSVNEPSIVSESLSLIHI